MTPDDAKQRAWELVNEFSAGADLDAHQCECAGHLVEWIASALLEAAGQWRTIDTAPMGAHDDPSSYFLGCRVEGKRLSVATCYRNQHGAYEWWVGGMTPTHWRPLPSPPGTPETSMDGNG